MLRFLIYYLIVAVDSRYVGSGAFLENVTDGLEDVAACSALFILRIIEHYFNS